MIASLSYHVCKHVSDLYESRVTVVTSPLNDLSNTTRSETLEAGGGESTFEQLGSLLSMDNKQLKS